MKSGVLDEPPTILFAWLFDNLLIQNYTEIMIKRKKIRKKARERGKKISRKRTFVRLISHRQKKHRAKPNSIKRKSESQTRQVTDSDLFEGVHRAKIRVVGIGGGGGNIIAEIVSRVQKIDFVALNTDLQALRELPRKVKAFSFGQEFTKGLGCGMDADLGERAARGEKDRLKKILEGYDICILIACLGGGTGSGVTPVLAEISQELRNLTFGIFLMPFAFEGARRKQIAEQALEKLKPYVNSYLVIPNERIFGIIDKKTSFTEAFSAVNRRLAETLEGFIETLALPGLINIDFADVRSVLEGKGRLAYLNSAIATGPVKAQEAGKSVLLNPLYEYGIEGADRILFNITGDRNLRMQEVAEISKAIYEQNPKARIIFGISCSGKLKDRIRITLLAIGCNKGKEMKMRKEKKKKEVIPFILGKEQKKVEASLVGEQEKVAAKKEEKPQLKNGKKLFSGKPKKKQEGSPLLPSPISKKEQMSLPPGQEGQKVGTKNTPPEKSSLSFVGEPLRIRRNALEVKKVVEEEIKELEKREKEWDIPAFLRKKQA